MASSASIVWRVHAVCSSADASACSASSRAARSTFSASLRDRLCSCSASSRAAATSRCAASRAAATSASACDRVVAAASSASARRAATLLSASARRWSASSVLCASCSCARAAASARSVLGLRPGVVAELVGLGPGQVHRTRRGRALLRGPVRGVGEDLLTLRLGGPHQQRRLLGGVGNCLLRLLGGGLELLARELHHAGRLGPVRGRLLVQARWLRAPPRGAGWPPRRRPAGRAPAARRRPAARGATGARAEPWEATTSEPVTSSCATSRTAAIL